jgi:hypothetical protein
MGPFCVVFEACVSKQRELREKYRARKEKLRTGEESLSAALRDIFQHREIKQTERKVMPVSLSLQNIHSLSMS